MEIILQPKEQNMTAEIQRAIDECFLGGGGKIILEKGLFLTGGLQTALYI